MDPNFKPYRTGMTMVLERYPCGKGGSRGRGVVFYLCKCDCGKEFIVTGDELSKHPYSCGCTPKPSPVGRPHDWAVGFKGRRLQLVGKDGNVAKIPSKTAIDVYVTRKG